MNERQVNDDLFDTILNTRKNHRGQSTNENVVHWISSVRLRYFELIEKHGQLKPLVDIKIRAPYLCTVRLVHNQISIEKEIDVRQTVQQLKKFLHELFHLPLNRLRVFYVDDVAFNMGVCGPEELKYPQRILHT